MKKNYQKPDVELTNFALLDVIASNDEVDVPIGGEWGSGSEIWD